LTFWSERTVINEMWRNGTPHPPPPPPHHKWAEDESIDGRVLVRRLDFFYFELDRCSFCKFFYFYLREAELIVYIRTQQESKKKGVGEK
jgi:hypothetical protein